MLQKCYKLLQNCYPYFSKIFFLNPKNPHSQNLSTTYPHSIHILSTHLSTIDTWEIQQYRKEKTMQVLQRLKMELSNQEYFSDEQYIQFLTENSLAPTDEYDKLTMQKNLLYTVLDVLEAVTNDIDLMSGISTEFSNIGQAYEFLEARIQQVKDKIASIPEPDEDYNCFSLMFTREPIPKHRYAVMDNRTIDEIIKEEFGK